MLNASPYEMGLNGSIILQYEGWESAIESTLPEYFSSPEMRTMFVALRGMYIAETAIDSIGLAHALGGIETQWAEVISQVLASDHQDGPMSCARIIKQAAMHREYIRCVANLAQVDASDDMDALCERIEGVMQAVQSYGSGTGKIWDIAENAESVLTFAKAAHDSGYKCGIDSLDLVYRPARGLLNVVTGAPSSGKSEFVDALLVLLAVKHRLKFCIFSPENFPKENHVLKLFDKMLSTTTGHRRTHRDIPDEEVLRGVKAVGRYFSFIDLQDGDSCLDALIQTLDRNWENLRPDGFVIDPWNELESKLRPSEKETDYIGRCLARLRRWARKRNIMLWVIAHPTKMRKKDDGTYEVPTPYDIAGSANWYNKADNALSVYRKGNSRFVEVHVQKIKQKIHGSKGLVDLIYDYTTGCYYDKNNCPDAVMHEAKVQDAKDGFSEEEF